MDQPRKDLRPNEAEAAHLPTGQLRHDRRLAFTPTYIVVGVYRMLADPAIRTPIWDKCRHGFIRGAVLGSIWATATFDLQEFFVSKFLMSSPKVAGLSSNSMFGFHIPVATYATILFISSQVTYILRFFLSKNIRIARERAWNHTVASRGKSAGFWGPYVEEWQKPPQVGRRGWESYLGGWLGRVLIMRVIVIPLNFYPIIGLLLSAALKALSTARYLHKPYFEVKKMTPQQVDVFLEERKWDYRVFGFAAALLEGLPIIGLAFSISNRIGGAMWAFDLEKRQNFFRSGELQPLPPSYVEVGGKIVELPPSIGKHVTRKDD